MLKTILRNFKESSEDIAKRTGANPNSIYEDLYREDIEIIKLHYDKASKMFSAGASTLIGSIALTIAFLEISKLGFRFFLITSILGFPRIWFRNTRMNKCFNTLNKKLKESKN